LYFIYCYYYYFPFFILSIFLTSSLHAGRTWPLHRLGTQNKQQGKTKNQIKIVFLCRSFFFPLCGCCHGYQPTVISSQTNWLYGNLYTYCCLCVCLGCVCVYNQNNRGV
jgi:hypothetical protein